MSRHDSLAGFSNEHIEILEPVTIASRRKVDHTYLCRLSCCGVEEVKRYTSILNWMKGTVCRCVKCAAIEKSEKQKHEIKIQTGGAIAKTDLWDEEQIKAAKGCSWVMAVMSGRIKVDLIHEAYAGENPFRLILDDEVPPIQQFMEILDRGDPYAPR